MHDIAEGNNVNQIEAELPDSSFDHGEDKMLDNKELVMSRKCLQQFLIIAETNDHHRETIWTAITGTTFVQNEVCPKSRFI